MPRSWYVARAGQSFGPFSEKHVETCLAAQQYRIDDLFWTDQLSSWVSLDQLSECINRPQATLQSPASKLRRLLRAQIDVLATLRDLLVAPSDFVANRLDRGTRSLTKAMSFYVKLFAVTFVITTTFEFLDNYQGGSELRLISFAIAQIALGIPLLYVGSRLFSSAPSLRGITGAVLYVDAVFLVCLSLVTTLLGWYFAAMQSALGDVDLIATEQLSCVRRSSIALSLILDEYKVFQSSSTAWDAIDEYAQFVVALPFCLIFGNLMRLRYGVSRAYYFLLATTTFTAVVLFTSWVVRIEAERASIAGNCYIEGGVSAARKFNRDTVASQLARRIDRQIANEFGVQEGVVIAVGPILVMELSPKIGAANGAVDTIANGFEAFYCGDNTDFLIAKTSLFPLRGVVRGSDGRVLAERHISAQQCQHAK